MHQTPDFAGNLNFLNLGELLQLLGTNGGSGTLRIISPLADEPGLVFVEKGSPVDARNDHLSGLDALYSLFGWTQGRFEFLQEPVEREKTIKKSRMEIILDGLRMLDEGKITRLAVETAPAETPGPETAHEPRPVSAGQPLPLIKGPLVDYSYVIDEEGFFDGEEIVREGNHGNWMWVILEGVAEIVKETAGGPIKLLRVADGSFLGSAASLLAGDNVRSATVLAIGNIQLGMLDSQLLTSELANLSSNFKTLVKCLDGRLRQVTEAAAAARAGNPSGLRHLKGKKTLIKEGQSEERLFRIREGEVVITRQTDRGPVVLSVLGKGEYFGAFPLADMGHEPYSAAVLASPGLKLGAVDPAKLQDEHHRMSATLKNILEHLTTSISVTTHIACGG
jgi:CRP-like cAMP-binding protein